MANQFGRPLKGRATRVHITVSADPVTLEEIEKFMQQRRQEERSYSRSDFYEEAAELLLKQAGQRTKIVPG